MIHEMMDMNGSWNLAQALEIDSRDNENALQWLENRCLY